MNGPSPSLSIMIMIVVLASVSLAPAQNPDYIFSVTSASGDTGDSVEVQVLFDNTGGDVSAWSYGLCHDSAVAEVTEVLDGADTLTVNGGSPPQFDTITLLDDGFTVAVVICFVGCAVLPPGSGYQFNDATYTLNGLTPEETALTFCESLGDPPVTLSAVVSGITEPPSVVDGALMIVGPPPQLFTLTASSHVVPYDPANGQAAFTSTASLLEDAASAGIPNGVDGLSLVLEHDALFLVPTVVGIGTELMAVNGGSGPDFFAPTLEPGRVTAAVIISFSGSDVLLAATPAEVMVIDYETNPGPLTFNLVGVNTSLDWGSETAVSTGALALGLTLEDGVVQLVPRETFLRGDVDDDGSPGLTDAIQFLNFLFNSGTVLCEDAGDFDNNDILAINDAILLLNFLFGSGTNPEPPFPDCGMDTGPDSCNIYNSCP